MPPFLPSMDVGNVEFNKWNRDAEQCVTEGHRRVCEAARIDDDPISTIGSRGLDLVDQGALPVARTVTKTFPNHVVSQTYL